jgi:hypothetical protein
LLAQAIEAEVDAFLAEMRGLRLPDGRERVVRHGLGPERMVQTGIGPIAMRRAKIGYLTPEQMATTYQAAVSAAQQCS